MWIVQLELNCLRKQVRRSETQDSLCQKCRCLSETLARLLTQGRELILHLVLFPPTLA